MKVKESKENNPKKIFNPVLFWDAEDIDVEKHAGYIISRVLDFGDEKDIKNLRKVYPEEKIIEVIKRRRNLMPQTGKFWALYFNIPLKEIECLRKYYRKMEQK
ncbi:MAG: hypothetical protein ABIN61_00170 [candidate division WOR-3 bacterium]